MNYSMYLLLTLATLPDAPADRATDADPDTPPVGAALATAPPALRQLLAAFRRQPISPPAPHAFEQQLQDTLRGVGRAVAQWTYNHVEPADPQALPAQVRFEAGPYTRLGAKTPQNAWTLFGPIRLWRGGHRPPPTKRGPTPSPPALA